MRRYTTPLERLTVKRVDLTDYDVYVTYRQGRVALTISDPEVSLDGGDTIIQTRLTQRQTAGFRGGTVRVQVNWVDSLGNRDATVIKDVDVSEQLLEEEL